MNTGDWSTDWATATQLVQEAAASLERARVVLRARGLRPGRTDWMLAQELADFLGVVADGAWSVLALIRKGRAALTDGAAAAALAESAAAIQPERPSHPR
jgi:hypothetical protein